MQTKIITIDNCRGETKNLNKIDFSIYQNKSNQEVEKQINEEVEKQIKEITNAINSGEVVAISTDTVWGLVCKIGDEKAVKRIYELKKRNLNKPINILISSFEMIEKLAVNINKNVFNIMETFKGSVTVVLNRKRNKENQKDKINNQSNKINIGLDNEKVGLDKNTIGLDNDTIGLDRNTIGVRMPDNNVLLEIIEKCGGAIFATSANISNEKVCETAGEVLKVFGGKVELIVDIKDDSFDKNNINLLQSKSGIKIKNDNNINQNIASTIIDLTGDEPKLLREGNVRFEEVLRVVEK
jgi:L-threonylcarbamoyladenylate synthase